MDIYLLGFDDFIPLIIIAWAIISGVIDSKKSKQKRLKREETKEAREDLEDIFDEETYRQEMRELEEELTREVEKGQINIPRNIFLPKTIVRKKEALEEAPEIKKVEKQKPRAFIEDDSEDRKKRQYEKLQTELKALEKKASTEALEKKIGKKDEERSFSEDLLKGVVWSEVLAEPKARKYMKSPFVRK